MKRILVVVAHLDDETFGIGGSLIKWSNENKEIKVVSICKGRDDVNAEARIKVFSNFCSELNISNKIFNYYDLNLQNVPLHQLTAIIEGEIDEFYPDTILTVLETDIHQDHRIVSHAVKIAARPIRRRFIKQILEFKIDDSSPFNSIYYDTVNDVSSVLDRKREFFERCTTENIPNCESTEYFKTIYREL